MDFVLSLALEFAPERLVGGYPARDQDVFGIKRFRCLDGFLKESEVERDRRRLAEANRERRNTRIYLSVLAGLLLAAIVAAGLAISIWRAALVEKKRADIEAENAQIAEAVALTAEAVALTAEVQAYIERDAAQEAKAAAVESSG